MGETSVFGNPNLEHTLICGVPFIYDKTVVDQNLRLIDNRYGNADIFNPPTERDPDYLYRGMSGKEFTEAVINGFIQSNKNRNFKTQRHTCFATNLAFAWIYAFTIYGLRDKPTFGNPNFVVKVKRTGLDYMKLGIQADVRGTVPISKITEVWEIRLLASEATGTKPMQKMTGVRKFSESEIKSIVLNGKEIFFGIKIEG